jgi:enoyl-CoA hydratase/carnithine racemase
LLRGGRRRAGSRGRGRERTERRRRLHAALRADFRICDTTAYFGVPPAKLGLVYPMDSTQLLVATAGVGMAKRMLFTGDMIKASEAMASGLVTELVESDPLAAALAFVAPMTRGAPISIEAGKIACNAVMTGQVDRYSAQVAELLRQGDASDDYREGVAAFAAKRPPKFTGK